MDVSVLQKALEDFSADLKKDAHSLMANKSAIRDLRSQREILEKDLELAKTKKALFEKELSELAEKIEQRKTELRELMNT